MSQIVDNYNNPKKVLVFNPEKTLILIGRSARTIAKTMNLKTQSVSYAALGKLISTGNYYFRYIPDDIEVDVNDIGILKLSDWDDLCGIERKTFRTRSMHNTGKRKKIKKNEN